MEELQSLFFLGRTLKNVSIGEEYLLDFLCVVESDDGVDVLERESPISSSQGLATLD